MPTGVSLRTVQRLYSEYVGVGPKWVLQRYRLHEALAQLHQGPDTDWARFALGLGYYDQAHFVRDFRAPVGRTPVRYERQRRDGPGRDHFSNLLRPMREALICEPLRTPVGRFGGVFRDLAVTELATTVIKALLARTQIPPESVDDVILGQGYANGEAPALGRVAALDAGLPVEVPGVQVDRRCGSGLQAVLDAAMRVQTGVADVIIAGYAGVAARRSCTRPGCDGAPARAERCWRTGSCAGA